MTSGDRPGGVPSRRTVLLGALGAGLGLGAAGALTACTGSSPVPGPTGSPTPTPPSADELAAGRAVLSARALLAGEAGFRGRPQVVSLVAAIAVAHRAHLAALGLPDDTPPPAGTPSGSPPATGSASPSVTGSASPSVTGSPSPSVAAFSAAVAVSSERTAAVEALADVVPTTPATAGLLARIAAARAVHADLLAGAARLPAPGELPVPATSATPAASPADPADPSAPSDPSTRSPGPGLPTDSPGSSDPASPTGSPTAPGSSPPATPLDSDGAAALSAILAGEHAAVFAYGVIAARAAPARTALARSLWAAHQDRRDALERRLVATGNAPVAAEAAYDLGRPPTGPAQVAALAARVEDGLAAVAWRAVTGSTGDVRLEAAADLVRAARRAAAWRGSGVPLPGDPV